jgi:hypothetical protein
MYVILKEQRQWIAFENGVLRRMFGSNGEAVTGDFRKLHVDELHNARFLSCIRMVEYEDGMKGAGYSICSRRH